MKGEVTVRGMASRGPRREDWGVGIKSKVS